MSSVRFGLFDFNPETRELRREGAPVRLQSQPAQVLRLLIAARGEVVTREALRDAIWNDGTFVDFDRGLNFCISQIRIALGDSADSPRFIRTVPKRGYQFIAPLAEPAPAPPPAHSRRWLLIASSIAAALALVAGGIWIGWPKQEMRIAVARFDNETGNAVLDPFADTVTDSVVAELTASGRYGVIGNAAILRRPRKDRNLIEIGATLHAQYVILGQVQPNGDKVRVLAHLIRLPQQTHVSVSRIDTAADPLATAQRIAADFERKLSSPPTARN